MKKDSIVFNNVKPLSKDDFINITKEIQSKTDMKLFKTVMNDSVKKINKSKEE